MARRDFLKLTGLVAAALLVHAAPAAVQAASSLHVEAEAGGRLYRGLPDGRVEVSLDSGRSWRLHTNFGAGLPVLALGSLKGSLQARLGCGSHSIPLVLLQDGRTWHTA